MYTNTVPGSLLPPTQSPIPVPLPLSITSAKSDQLRIPRQPIPPNPAFPKSLLHQIPPRLIEPDLPHPHDPLHFLLTLLIQTAAGIAFGDIGAEIEGAGVQAGLDVGEEGGSLVGVGVAGTAQAEVGGVGGGREEVLN